MLYSCSISWLANIYFHGNLWFWPTSWVSVLFDRWLNQLPGSFSPPCLLLGQSWHCNTWRWCRRRHCTSGPDVHDLLCQEFCGPSRDAFVLLFLMTSPFLWFGYMIWLMWSMNPPTFYAEQLRELLGKKDSCTVTAPENAVFGDCPQAGQSWNGQLVEWISVPCTFFGASSRSFLHMRDSADQTLFGGVVKGVTEQDRLVSLKSRYFEVQICFFLVGDHDDTWWSTRLLLYNLHDILVCRILQTALRPSCQGGYTRSVAPAAAARVWVWGLNGGSHGRKVHEASTFLVFWTSFVLQTNPIRAIVIVSWHSDALLQLVLFQLWEIAC